MAAGVGALLAVLAVLVAAGLYTAAGHRAVASLVGTLTGGSVAVYGLSGTLPNHLHIVRLELRDAHGAWLRLEGLVLDWDAFAVMANRVEAARLHAAGAVMLRRPIPSGKTSATALHVGDLAIGRLDLRQAAIGQPAMLTVSGSVDYRSAADMRAKIIARRLDNFGRYRIDGGIADGMVAGSADIAEGSTGLVGNMLGLPGLGAVNLQARATILRRTNSLSLRATAGPLRAAAAGTFDLAARAGGLNFAVEAPAMRPRGDIAWHSLSVTGAVRGRFDQPLVDAKLEIEKGSAFGFAARLLRLELKGAGGSARLAGSAEQLTIPGSRPNLFAATPVRLSADITLPAKSRALRFALDHPILQVQGSATLGGKRTAAATIRLPSLAPLAAAAGFGTEGSAMFNARLSEPQGGLYRVEVDGDIAPRGSDLMARMLGPHAGMSLTASMTGATLQSARGVLTSRGLSVEFQGTGSNRLNYDWQVAVPDLSSVASALSGSFKLHGSLAGTSPDLRLIAKGNADVGTKTLARQSIAIEAAATGLPEAKSGDLRLSGALAGGPAILAATFSRSEKGLRVMIRHGAWKSAELSGDVVVANATSMHGAVALRMRDLADLAPLIGPVSGRLEAHAGIAPGHGAVLIVPHAALENVRYGNIAAGRIDLSGTVVGLTDPLADPVTDIAVKVSGLSAAHVGGDAELTAKGPLDQLTLRASSKLSAYGAPVTATARAGANIRTRQVTLQRLNLSWQHDALMLMSPARIDLSQGVAIDKFQAKIGTGRVMVAGSLTPRLSLTATATGITPDMAGPALPLALAGSFSATAHLSGTLAAPSGEIAIHGRDIHMPQAPSTAASTLEAHAQLQQDMIALNARLSGGKAVQLTADGRIPLSSTKPVAIAAKGNADLVLLAAPLAASGQSLQGIVSIDARLGGTWSSPDAAGTIEIANGEFQDYTRGIRLNKLQGRIEGQGARIRIASLSAMAGTGTLTASGTVDVGTPGIPVNIAIAAKDARPIASDLLSATLQSDLKLTGKFGERLVLAGDVKVAKADINVPNKFPPNVAEIAIHRQGQPAGAPPSPRHEIALDIAVSSPGQVFVRGRGLDAEFSGTLKITGTSAAPQVLGALQMRRGTFSLAGTVLDFKSGKIGFDGASLRNRLDPTLDFVAQTASGGVTATLNISGYASEPKVQLTSTPSLPQDEIMARLLFQQSATQLSALQVAEMADAIASLSGAGSGINPVASLRTSLGLDRLAVSNASSASGSSAGTTIEAGKYVSRGLYVGTTQNVSGGTRAVVQVDITKHLKAQAAMGTGMRGAGTSPLTPAQDPGDSVGLMYQLEY